MVTRRHFLRTTAGLGAGVLLPLSFLDKARAQSSPLLDPLTQPKFVNPLPNPLTPGYIFRPTSPGSLSQPPLFDVQIEQIVHETGLVDPSTGRRLRTRVWGYGTPTQPAVYPGYTFEIRRGQKIKVRYSNRLDNVTYPADVPVDQTIHWADPLNGGNPANVPYTGPVPVVAHLHGGDTAYQFDGLPDAWSTPGDALKGRLFSPLYTYDNRQEATQLFYHDHALGLTRLNLYMGLAGNYIIRDANEDALRLPRYPYEVPILIQDRRVMVNGDLFYPSRDENNPDAPIPTHLPEMFGDIILVNGVAWPVLEVEPRKYRLRLVNGSDARFYDLRLANGLPFVQIGSDQGLLNSPVMNAIISLAPGERVDAIVDFARLQGQTIIVQNSANAPYPSGDPVFSETTGQIMAFRVSLPKSNVPDYPIPGHLRPVNGTLLPPKGAVRTRRILLFEGTDRFNRLQTTLGIVDPSRPTLDGTLIFDDPITENPAVGDTEIWEFYNTTADAHPMHMHLVNFRVLDRQKFLGTVVPKTNSDGSQGGLLQADSIRLLGAPRIPQPGERGLKDTVKTFPGEVTRVMARFDRPGEYVYHCHIVSHEDHDMMRPYYVGPIPAGR